VAQPFFDRRVRCAVNPAVGTESERHRLDETSADKPINVAIVGGGPAGMEAARVAAGRGHRVTLFEKSGQLGGALRFAAMVYEPNHRYLDWIVRQMEHPNIEIRLNTTASPGTLAAADRIIVATGAKRVRPDIAGADQDHVVDGDDLRALLTGEGLTDSAMSKVPRWTRAAMSVGRRVGVFDRPERIGRLSEFYMPVGDTVVIIGGGLVGIELAEFLVDRDRKVTVVEEGAYLAPEMAHPRRWRVLDDLRHHGAELLDNTEVVSIGAKAVEVRSGDARSHLPADTVVLATGLEGDESYAESLRSANIDPIVIGDCTGVSYLEGAIRDGYEAAISLG
jgi:2,4-dienoyl-CoA reductase (NADPH2)